MSQSAHLGPDQQVYQQLATMAAEGQPGVLATIVEAALSTPRHLGSKMIIHDDGRLTGSIGGGQAEALVIEAAGLVLAGGECRLLELDLARGTGVCGGRMKVFLEPVLRTSHLVVFGAGHVGRALLELAIPVSFRVTLVDDRPEFLEPYADHPGARILQAGPAELGPHLEPDAGGGVLVATRGHELDQDYVAALLDLERDRGRKWGFFGVLGSRRKVAILRKALLTQDSTHQARLAELQMPVGVATGAETPHEIALSILAEAMAVLRGVPYLPDGQGAAAGLPLQRTWRRDGANQEESP
jgi:xanthine dehydrogenase accessory factor